MATLTPGQAAIMQSRLATQHRIDLASVARLTARQVNDLLLAISGEDDKTFARILRISLPEIIDSNGATAATLAAAYFDSSRNIYIASGQAPNKRKNFVASAVQFMRSGNPLAIQQTATKEAGYWIGNSITGKFERNQTITPIKQIAEKSALNYSRELITINTKEDPIAEEEPARVVRPDGCNFCKYMAFNVGGQKFHDGCGCGLQPRWKAELFDRPEWADDFEDKLNDSIENIVASDGTSMTTKNIMKEMRKIEAEKVENSR